MDKTENRIRAGLAYIWNGGPTSEGIPARVIAEIDEREAAAERLIGWVQLGIVVFFTALYSLTPRAEGGSGENFVPVTLAAYFAFTVLRVVLSYRMTLPRWYLILSILADVSLLCGLIFSFHIQYAQPPSFYLKAPTLMYLFIFISLRALRFDPRYVLITGAIGVLGWLVLAGYAVMVNGGDMHITRNYVQYLTSNSILIGAEVDKTITIFGVTAILSLVLYRGRQMLFDSIQSQVAADDLKRFFSPEVASSITLSDNLPSAGKGELRDAAILFVDVRSFTTTADAMEPEQVMQVLGHYQDLALSEIERHHGQVDKYLGDGILATFGAVRPSDSHAADALRAAVAVVAAVEAARPAFRDMGWPGDFAVGVAMACGSITVGVVGAQGRLEFTVIGNAVNLAAKLESANKHNGTRAVTDGASFAVALAQGYEGEAVEIRAALAVHGLSRPLDLVVLA